VRIVKTTGSSQFFVWLKSFAMLPFGIIPYYFCPQTLINLKIWMQKSVEIPQKVIIGRLLMPMAL